MRRMEYWKLEDQSEGQSFSWSRTYRMSIKVRTYLIFELKYLHDKSEVFILSNRINKKIN